MSKLKNVKVLTTSAMLLALATILGFFKIPITQLIEIRFGTIPVSIAGYLFGPGIGAIIGAFSDILGYLVKPTGPFFPGFTISSLLSGLVFGFVLHTKEPKKVPIVRIIIASFIHSFVIGALVNSFNLFVLYGNLKDGNILAYFTLVLSRLPKEAIMFPINTVIYSLIMIPAYYLRIQFFKEKK